MDRKKLGQNKARRKDDDMEEKVLRETKILKLLSHVHLVRLYDIIDTRTHIFLVMEYVSGGDLFDYIVHHGKVPEDLAREIFQQIIAAVEYCHHNSVIHRDLKPENILLYKEMNVKLADFGLANFLSDGMFLKTSCGSPNYAAPEVVSGKLYAGPEVDVWSCGVILYALLCGSLPFDDENIPNLFKKIKGGIYTLPSHLSDLARDLIPKMLIVDAVKRITIAEIRQHPWFQIKLPTYLSISPEQRMRQVHLIDEDVLREVVQKIGFSPDQIVDAVRNGDRNQITVAYYLIAEYLRRLREAESGQPTMDDMEVETSGPSPFCLTASPDDLLLSTNGVLSASGNNIAYPPQRHDLLEDGDNSIERALFGGPTPGGGDPMEGVTLTNFMGFSARDRPPPGLREPSAPPRKWYLGIQTRNPPSAVMNELYRALKLLGFEWKIITAYNVRCRRADTDKTKSLKLSVQLYKVHDARFLLDIQKLKGATFPFMDVCSRLMHELRV